MKEWLIWIVGFILAVVIATQFGNWVADGHQQQNICQDSGTPC